MSNDTITTDEIHRIAADARPDMASFLNCNPINPRIQDALTDHGIPADTVTGMIATTYRDHGDEHLFIKVSGDAVTDSSGDVIVDGALDQFCISNLDDGKVWESLGPKEEIPCPAVLTPNDDYYEAFSDRTPH